MRSIGLHLRLTSTLKSLIEKAQRLEIDIFQFFLMHEESGRLFNPSPEDFAFFLESREKFFKQIYVHGSYWINIAGVKIMHHASLQRELTLAQKLTCNSLVLHAGSAKGGRNKLDGIDAVVRVLNEITYKKYSVQIMLENSAHGRMTVGGDIEDFAIILSKLESPDSISFCIDTAHAYSYGYDISNQEAQKKFIDLLEQTIGIHRIALIHLNETKQKLGSKSDKHEIIGDGLIGEALLKDFVKEPRLAHIPIIMELPTMAEEQEKEIIEKVRSWHI